MVLAPDAMHQVTADAAGAMPKFALFGLSHWLILTATCVVPYALSQWTQGKPGTGRARAVTVAWSAVLLLNYLFILVWATLVGKLTRWPNALPLQLCDWASGAVILALLWRRQQPYELAYFWGLSGTVQALLTPDISAGLGDPLVVAFFVGHCGIVGGVLFLTWGLAMRPSAGAVWRAWLWSQVYLVCAGLVNWACSVNFGYLGAKPPHASLLDWFGPWPWYLGTLEAVGLLFYGLFYLPFWITDRRGA